MGYSPGYFIALWLLLTPVWTYKWDKKQLTIKVMQTKITATVKVAPDGYCGSQSTSSLTWPKGYNGWDVCTKLCNTGNMQSRSSRLDFNTARSYSETASAILPGRCSDRYSSVDTRYSSTSSSLTVTVSVSTTDMDAYTLPTVSASTTVSFRDFSFCREEDETILINFVL